MITALFGKAQWSTRVRRWQASQISDGAAAVVVTSRAKAEELGAPILAEIGAHGVVAGPIRRCSGSAATVDPRASTRWPLLQAVGAG